MLGRYLQAKNDGTGNDVLSLAELSSSTLSKVKTIVEQAYISLHANE